MWLQASLGPSTRLSNSLPCGLLDGEISVAGKENLPELTRENWGDYDRVREHCSAL